MTLLIFVSCELFDANGRMWKADTTATCDLQSPDDFHENVSRIREALIEAGRYRGAVSVAITYMHTIKWED